MTVRFDEPALVARLERLPRPHRVVFAAACAERLIPAYADFSQRSRRGDAKALGEILGRLWDGLCRDEVTSAALQSDLDECMKLLPCEGEVPWIPEQAAAEDAAGAVAYALRCRQNGRSQEAAWAARRGYEARDHHVVQRDRIDTNTVGAEASILAHPIVQRELERQLRDLDDLSSADDLPQAATRLRARAMAEGAPLSGSTDPPPRPPHPTERK